MFLRYGIALTFFVSGFCSLTFQVAWRKALSQTIGVDFFSTTLIVAIFMLGLALGAEIGNMCLRRLTRPIFGYLIAEILVTLFGLLSIQAIYFMPNLSVMLGTGVGSSGYVADFVSNSLLLLVPTICMGVSFPIIVHYFRRIFVPGAAVGFLYSSNIFGAAIGALASGLYLVGTFGLSGTVVLASGVNLLQIAYVWYLVRSKKDLDLDGVPTEALDSPAPANGRHRNMVLGIAFTIGFVALAFEMIFVRMAMMYFTANNYVFPIVVFCYLLLMAAGNQLSGHLLDRNYNSGRLFNRLAIATCAAILLSLTLPFILTLSGIGLEVFNFSQPRYINFGPKGMIFGALLLSFLMMLPVATISAMFPIFVHAITSDREKLGTNVGTVYFVQTIGNVSGALIAGIVLLPNLGAVRTLQLGVATVIACAAAFSLLQRMRSPRSFLGMAVIGGAALAVTPAAFYSNVVRGGHVPERFSEEVEGVALKYDSAGGTAINIGAERAASYARIDPFVSNLQDTITIYDAVVQKPIKRVLIIGIGTGVLAVQLQQRYPEAKLVIVELLDVVIREMREHGDTALKDLLARSDVYITDGRRYVSRKAIPDAERFDLIQIGVFHVTSSGAGGLFTDEFQRQLRSILTPDGAISYNAYLPAVKTAFGIFQKGIVYSRELGRQVTDALFFNNDAVDIEAGLRRYPAVIAQLPHTMPDSKTVKTLVPAWYFTPDDPRYFFTDREVILSALDGIAIQSDNLPATEFYFTQRISWAPDQQFSSTKLDPRYWEKIAGYALDGSFGGENLASKAIVTVSESSSPEHGARQLVDGLNSIASKWSLDKGDGWVRFDFDEHRPVRIRGYELSVSSNSVEQAPKEWALEGSDDGNNWHVVHRVTNFTKWDGISGGREYPSFARVFWFANDVAYRQYRMSITSTTGRKGLILTEIRLFEQSVFGHETMLNPKASQ